MLSPDPSLSPAAHDAAAAVGGGAAAFHVSTGGRLDPWVQREWLLTNGLGAFASSSIVGCNTRRYHGLLCAATVPPVGRVLALSRLGETVYLDGDATRPHELGVNLFRDAVHPRGERYLTAFALWHTARWEYEVAARASRRSCCSAGGGTWPACGTPSTPAGRPAAGRCGSTSPRSPRSATSTGPAAATGPTST
jgi:hypothetical protein